MAEAFEALDRLRAVRSGYPIGLLLRIRSVGLLSSLYERLVLAGLRLVTVPVIRASRDRMLLWPLRLLGHVGCTLFLPVPKIWYFLRLEAPLFFKLCVLAVSLGPGRLKGRHLKESSLVLQRLAVDDVDVLEVVQHLLFCRFDLLDCLRDVLPHLIASVFDVLANLGQPIQIYRQLLVITSILLLVLQGLLLVDEVSELLKSLFELRVLSPGAR